MRITDEYKRLNSSLHISRRGYGVGGSFWAGMVWTFALRMKANSVLDYGAGKQTLEKSGLSRHISVYSYDPCIPEIAKEPQSADVVVCTDVLEHIEPNCLLNVIKHLDFLSSKGLFLSIATVKGDKFLEDGRNNHLIIGNKKWWLKQFPKNWQVRILGEDDEKFWCEVKKCQ